MSVIFYDILQIMPLGKARPCESLEELLEEADFVSLHVPETPETKNMIGKRELDIMKPGSYLLNASRGTVVNLDDLKESLDSGKLGGAAIDVFPKEPKSNGSGFYSVLQNCRNVLLTPHIGEKSPKSQ